ncbi:hypothetical protein BH10ACT11_BH10ACT11_13980 [soil metagenome]
MADYELAFEQEISIDRQRRHQLRKRAVSRSKARRINRVEHRGKINFGVLLVALVLTTVTVTVIMFETLALLMG